MNDKIKHQHNIDKLCNVERAVVALEPIFGEAPANKDGWAHASTSGGTLRAWTILSDLFRMADDVFERIMAVDPNRIRAGRFELQ